MQHNKSSRDALLTRAQQEDATPDEQLDAGQLKRKRDREKKRKQRVGEKQERAASTAATEKEWWDGNRATLNPDTLAAMVEQDAYVLDVLLSMKTVIDVQQLDPELIQIVVSLVKERGVVHLDRIVKDADIPPDWSEKSYWRDSALLARLEAEGEPTAQYVRFGLLVALPDWSVVEFLHKKARWDWWKAADLVGYYTERNRNTARHR
jgi:hypothetical protein